MMLYSIANGRKKLLEQVNDEAFAQKMMGDGIAITPDEGKVYAPCDGVISMVFPTGHALGILSKDGIEVLIHIGIDTVELNGVGFNAYVAQGDEVKAHQLLIDVDINMVEKAGYEVDMMVIITNTDSYHQITPSLKDELTIQDILLEIE